MNYKVTDKFIDENLTDFNTVNVTELEGVPHPFYLRENTLDFFILDEIFGHECYDISMKNSRMYTHYAEEFNVRPTQNIIDVGGNIGIASVYYALKFPDAQIVTIEPEKDNFYLMQKHIQHYPNITPIRGAVWDKNTELCITNRSEAVRRDGLKNAGKFRVGEESVENEEKIPAYTIDTLIEKYDMDMVDNLKMDVEGAEREIFSGDFEKWLPKVRILALEHHDFYKPGSTKAVFKALANYDFYYLYDNSDDLGTMMFLMHQK